MHIHFHGQHIYPSLHLIIYYISTVLIIQNLNGPSMSHVCGSRGRSDVVATHCIYFIQYMYVHVHAVYTYEGMLLHMHVGCNLVYLDS